MTDTPLIVVHAVAAGYALLFGAFQLLRRTREAPCTGLSAGSGSLPSTSSS
ncbi:hypothetical protein [Pseudarthrobacter chlorophenolicus]|uniref:hypothetical protein n=1 Tax=Pseudarthrobacter chlorophenolicus TaxID=85085 RepID=UPI00209ABD0E|nr:hypothetical protein [Pseudarthrobacter chlorophenolicus]